MPLDPEARRTVACSITVAAALLIAAGCGPVVRPEAPGDEPTPPHGITHPVPAGTGRGALLGEMCPQGAAGRPGLSPLAVRDVSWSSEAGDLLAPLTRGTAAQFAVLALDGRRAGVFASVGTADVGGTDVAIGSFGGSPPCSAPAAVGQAVTANPACLAAQRGCGLAVATLGAPGGAFGEGEAPEVVVGGACKSGDALAIDIDGDGAPELFPLASFVDPTRAPADEVSAAAVMAPACTASFALYGLIAPPAPGVAMDGKLKLELDVLGVLDVDGDGRREVVVAFRYTEGRTIAVYSAMRTAARLELVGESAPWP